MSLGSRSAAGLSTILAFVTAGGHAQATDSNIHLKIAECERAEITTARLVELVRTEISPRALSLGDASEPQADLVTEIRLCEGSTDGAEIRLYRDGQSVARRRVDLSDVAGDSRARTLAVALAEMIVAQALPQAAAPQVKQEPGDVAAASAAPVEGPSKATEPPVPVTPARTHHTSQSANQEPQRHAETRLGAGLSIRKYAKPGAPLLGTWVALAFRGVKSELVLATSKSHTDTGEVVLNCAALALAVDAVTFLRKPQLVSRVRVESGGTWASGQANSTITNAHSAAAVTSAAMVEFALRGRIHSSISFEVRTLAGYSGGLTARANGVAVASTSGWLAGATLGMDVNLTD